MVPSAYVRTTVITARPLTKKDLIFSMTFTIASLNADRVGVRKPIERSYPSINRLLQKHIYPQRGIIPPRRPTASGDPVRRPWRLLVWFVGDQVQRTSRLQAISANVLGRIEKRHGDDDGAPPLAPWEMRVPRRAPQQHMLGPIYAS